MQIAPSTYYARRSRPPSARSLLDEALKAEISRVHKNQLLGAGGPQDARDAGSPLRSPSVTEPVTWPAVPSNASCGLWVYRGVRRAKSPRTTRSAPPDRCPADLVKRHFSAFRPNELWVADITYVRTFSGWVYVAFVTDVFSRRIMGWQTTYRPVCTDLALDALKMAVWQRKRTGADLSGLVHHLRPRRAVPSHPLRTGPIRLRGSRLCRL
ncbi:DDE-type integrase/transposase/recombinase [Actinomyces viscosus]|uniref:DDE-type integrase/transposase/recombinase n=1 Tax=Actinomyces viscosus TaxID=1656 RepID=UPI0038B8A771